MKARVWCFVVVAPLIAAGCAMPNDGAPPGAHDFSQETISPGSAVLQGPGTVVSGTAGVAVAGQQGSQQIVEAEALEANEVHAQMIYANHIQSPDIHGTIHQTGGVRMDRSVGDLKAATVTASVLYADTIKADRVIADQIYVREIDRR